MLLRSYVLLSFAVLPCFAEGKLVRKILNVTWEVGSPNGNSREMAFVNGMMPGPVLYFDEGDDVEVWTPRTSCTSEPRQPFPQPHQPQYINWVWVSDYSQQPFTLQQ